MIVHQTKLRQLTLGIQLAAGIALLTASYLTTEQDWNNELLATTVHTEQSVIDNALGKLKSALGCRGKSFPASI